MHLSLLWLLLSFFLFFLIQGPLGVDGKPVSTSFCHHVDQQQRVVSASASVFGLPV